MRFLLSTVFVAVWDVGILGFEAMVFGGKSNQTAQIFHLETSKNGGCRVVSQSLHSALSLDPSQKVSMVSFRILSSKVFTRENFDRKNADLFHITLEG